MTERDLLPLLAVAVELDDLADELVAWAADRLLAAPDDAVDRRARWVHAELDRLGVQRETRDPAEWRRRSR